MDEDTLTVWLDTALLMLGSFVLLTVLMVTVLNPPAKSSETAGIQAPGNVIVEIEWPGAIDADVDLWVQAPGDLPVGYSSTNGKIFNLLRDDLGKANDVTDRNYEVAYSRGMPTGEYIVNVHLYRGIAGGSIPVKVTVSCKTTADRSARQLATTTVELRHDNQEITAMRFTLDDQGALVPGSINNLFRELRTAKS